MKLVDSETTLQLTDDKRFETSPVWSHDGLYIAYLSISEDGASCEINLVSVLGGMPRTLTVCSLLPPESAPPPLSWSRDNQYLFFATLDAASGNQALTRLDINTGEQDQVIPPEPGLKYSALLPSQKNNKLVFTRSDTSTHSILQLDLDDPSLPPVNLYTSSAPVWGLYWGVEERSIYIVTEEDERTPSLKNISLSGALQRQLALSPDINLGMDISIQNNGIAYSKVDAEADLWQRELDAQQSQRSSMSSTLYELLPSISPSGTHVAFFSDRNGGAALWVGNLETGEAVELSPVNGSDLSKPVWTVGEEHIVYVSSSGIIQVNKNSGSSTSLSEDKTPYPVHIASTGELYYTRDSSTPSIYRLEKGSQDSERIMTDHILLGIHDNIFYSINLEQDSVLARTTLTDSQGLPGIKLDFSSIPTEYASWQFTSDGFYYIIRSQKWEIRYFSFETGKSEVIEQFPKGQARALSLSSKRHILYYDLEILNDIDILMLEEFDQGCRLL